MLIYYIFTNAKLSKEKKKKALWIIGWIFFFPAPLSVLIWNSKYNKKTKILLLVLLWGGLIIFGNLTSTDTNQIKDKIIECYSYDTYEQLELLYGIENLNGLYETDKCDNVKIKNNNNQELNIVISDNKKLQSISINNKYIYNIDKSYDIYNINLIDIKEQADPKLKQEREKLNKLFGDEEGKSNPFENNEKEIRKFVLAFNNKFNNKIDKIDWEKNHGIATLHINDKSFKVNDHNDGFIVDFEFTNGKSSINEYKEIVKQITEIFDDSILEDDFEIKFQKAKEQEHKQIEISKIVSIEMHYNTEQVGFMSGDRYFITLIGKQYNK